MSPGTAELALCKKSPLSTRTVAGSQVGKDGLGHTWEEKAVCKGDQRVSPVAVLGLCIRQTKVPNISWVALRQVHAFGPTVLIA